MTRAMFAAGALMAALAAPAYAQGNSQNAPGHQGTPPGQSQSQGQGQGQSHANTPAPPSRNPLAPVAVVGGPMVGGGPVGIGTTPIAWVDDATLLNPGGVALSLSAVRWDGSGTSEIDAPIVNAALGLAPRVQLSASVPRTLGSSDPTGAAGGVGTSFFSAKVQLLNDRARNVKIAAAPTLQLLGSGVVAALGPNEGRVRWGLPVSAEIDRGVARLYGGGGYFSPGLWFTGAAFAVQVASRMAVNVGVSRAWRVGDAIDPTLVDQDRKEITGGVAYGLTPHISAYGAIGQTFATLDANGAGTTVSGGVSLWFTAPVH